MRELFHVSALIAPKQLFAVTKFLAARKAMNVEIKPFGAEEPAAAQRKGTGGTDQKLSVIIDFLKKSGGTAERRAIKQAVLDSGIHITNIGDPIKKGIQRKLLKKGKVRGMYSLVGGA